MSNTGRLELTIQRRMNNSFGTSTHKGYIENGVTLKQLFKLHYIGQGGKGQGIQADSPHPNETHSHTRSYKQKQDDAQA